MATPAIPDIMIGVDLGLVTEDKILHIIERIIAKADPSGLPPSAPAHEAPTGSRAIWI